MRKIVFLGNPNVGKSALINAMSNSQIKVGNWPGVTVEKIEAEFTYKNEKIMLVDLPGTYNFTNTHEGKITTEILLEKDYDLIVNVVDATNLERNLNITLLARELEMPMIVLLNFDDDVTKQGLVIDTTKLQRYLQVPIFRTSATKRTGLNQVLDYFVDFELKRVNEYNIYYDNDIDMCIEKIISILKDDEVSIGSYGYKYFAYRLFEKEPHFTMLLSESTLGKVNDAIYRGNFSLQESTSNQLQIKRYDQIKKILERVIDKRGVSRYLWTKRIDSLVLNKWLGLPIFFVFSLYFLSLIFNVANPLVDWIDGFVNDYIAYHLTNMTNEWPSWLQAMLVQGVLGGVGGVLVFTPLMYFIYLLMAILEESGIMSRVAFVMDRAMKALGLNGKAFISMIIGFGCTVPAITSTRTLESEGQRKATALMLPFVSCGARLPVYALFGAAFFSQSFGLVVTSLYLIGIIIAIAVGLVLKALKLYKHDEKESFTIELPPYRVPEARILFKNVNNRLKGFIKRVTTLIMIVLFFIWALSYFPTGEIKESYLFKATSFVKPIFKPAGFGESDIAVAAIPTSIVAKEAVVGTIQTLSGVEEEESNERPEESYLSYQFVALFESVVDSAKAIIPNVSNVTSLFSAEPDEEVEATLNSASKMFVDEQGKVLDDASLRAYAYMIFILLLTPCVVAMATIKKEFGYKFALQVIGLTIAIPYLMSVLVFQIGSLLFT